MFTIKLNIIWMGRKLCILDQVKMVDWRNTGENKGLYLLDFNTLKMKYIDNTIYIYI